MVAIVAMFAMVAMSDLCLFKAHHVVSKRRGENVIGARPAQEELVDVVPSY